MADGFKANAAFFQLGFLDKTAVSLGMQFKEMLPVLWMKAEAKGRCPALDDDIPEMLILPENKFAVLINENAFASFEETIQAHPEIQTVFIVTDYEVTIARWLRVWECKHLTSYIGITLITSVSTMGGINNDK